MPTESIDVFFIFTAKEGPLEKLVRTDKAGGVGGEGLALDHRFEDLEDLCAHFSGFCDCELEEEHGDVAFDLVG